MLDRARDASRNRKQPLWEDVEDSYENMLSVQVDADGLSFTELDETELTEELKKTK
jgi:hypothetical protein